jgi:Spy/CpxP family protein refolding chaperone
VLADVIRDVVRETSLMARVAGTCALLAALAASAGWAGQTDWRQAPRDRQAAPQERPFKWWTHEPTRKELGLTAEQAAKAEEIFQATVPRLRELWKALDRREAELSALIRERTVDESVIAAKIDEIEQVRAELNKTRTLMLYRIHRLLTPEQHEKLNAIHDRERARRRGGESHRER